MTTEQILEKDVNILHQIEDAMMSLRSDHRAKAVALYNKFSELRDNLVLSIESNMTALQLERSKQSNTTLEVIL